MRTARTSPGVRDSCPGQKVQGPEFRSRTGAEAKSDGRLDRSVEMITQRPTTGSRLSSGTSRVLLLGARLTGQKGGQRLPYGLGLEEHRGDLVANRQADPDAGRQHPAGGDGAH